MNDTTIGLIGLGKISATHLRALKDIDVVEVIGGYDLEPGTTLTFRDGPRPVYMSVDQLLAAKPTTIIVATPTPTHYECCRQVLASDRPVRLIIEKPIATSLAEVDDVLAKRQGFEQIGLYHASHAPEVMWAVARIAQWRGRFGDVISYTASFADPYRGADRRYTESLVDSWIDSGINALSVALRFLNLTAIDRLTTLSAQQSCFEASVRFGETQGEVRGTVRTDWNVPEAAKHTELAFADGTRLYLNHQAVSGRLASGSAVLDEFAYDGKRPRLEAHYFNAFKSLFVEGSGYYSTVQSRRLHELLLSRWT